MQKLPYRKAPRVGRGGKQAELLLCNWWCELGFAARQSSATAATGVTSTAFAIPKLCKTMAGPLSS
jgi:hypothetical protein